MLHSILISGSFPQKRFSKALEIRAKLLGGDFTYENDPDFVIFDSESKSIGIELIRELKYKIGRKPFQRIIKIFFIPQAEKLTLQAQNALLKTLEEPPQHTYIILSCHNPDLLIATIVSRCQIIPLSGENPINENLPLAFIIELFTKNPGERIDAISQYTKNKDEANQFCHSALKTLHGNLISKQLAYNCGLILNSLKLLNQNINPKLVLENMVLEFK